MNSKKDSKKKQNINYIKPAEAPFITRLKQQAGFVEGPSIDTKREKLPQYEDGDDDDDREDEKPVVVVMKDGDFTEDEANLYNKIKKEVEAIDKADLSQRVIFKRKTKPEESTSEESPKEVKKKKKEKEKEKKPKKTILSFNDDEEEE